MRHLIVGDGHYNNRPGELQRWQRLLEQALRDDVDEISILGDFFELWIALPGLMPAWQDAFLEPLRALRARGVYLRYVVGNKDYYVDTWNRRSRLFDEVVATDVVIACSRGPLYLAHGDLVNTADRQYRLWRAFSRSGFIRFVGRALPAFVMKRLSLAIAARLQTTNLEHKSYYPESSLRALAEQWRERCAVMVFGHFHVHREFEHAGIQVVTLPFLCSQNAGMLVQDEGISLFSA
jgi:UDP-2,3-diacylglucosamine hydrolase